MKFREVQNQVVVLDLQQQSKIKGGTSSSNTTTAIVIEDVDSV